MHPTANNPTDRKLAFPDVPTVSVAQKEHSIVEGSPLSVNCQVDANPAPTLVSWRPLLAEGEFESAVPPRLPSANDTNSSPAASSQPTANSAPGTRNAVATPSRPGALLEFERVGRELNQAVFECFAQNALGVSQPVDVRLNVLFAPYLVNTSASESVQLSASAQLACLFDGNPAPDVRWLYTSPFAGAREPSAALELLSGKSGGGQHLVVANASYKHEGDYFCEARNKVNGVNYSVRSSNIALDVFGEPQFLNVAAHHATKQQLSLAKAAQGARANLTLQFCADPAPNKVYWQFGSNRLDVR